MAVDGTGRARIEEEEVGYNWDELNRLAKQIERDIDGQFSAFNMEPWTSGTGTADQVKLNKLEASLKRLSNVIEMMNELFEQLGSSKPSGTGPSYLLSRHQEVHLEYQRDLRKLRNQLSKSREHTDLITSVREEIDSYRNMSSEQYTQKERNMLDSAHRETDHIVDMAHVAHSNLITQKSGLSGTIKKIQDAAERFPVINQVMMKIRVRRRRDQVILGTIIALCIFIFFL